MKQRIHAKARTRADYAEDDCAPSVLTGGEIRITHGMGKRDADAGAGSRADNGAIDQRVA